MNWWNNPLGTMYGPYFLGIYAAFIVVAALVARWMIRWRDPTRGFATPAVPESPDPYLMAYLRGGEFEVARLALFDLLHRGVVEQTETRSFFGLSRKQFFGLAPGAQLEGLSPVLQSVARWVGKKREGKNIFRDGIVTAVAKYAKDMQQEAERLGLATPTNDLWRQRGIAFLACASIVALGAYKFAAAMMTGHRNVAFLLVLGIVGCLFAVWIGGPRKLTDLGRRTLKALQTAFAGLQKNSSLAKGETPDRHLVLAMGIFGIAALQGTAHGAFYDLYRHSAGSSGGCGSGCGSGCGGGCGGGGCGGCGG
jgi:uncharacterized protein (TIGR04222 family)